MLRLSFAPLSSSWACEVGLPFHHKIRVYTFDVALLKFFDTPSRWVLGPDTSNLVAGILHDEETELHHSVKDVVKLHQAAETFNFGNAMLHFSKTRAVEGERSLLASTNPPSSEAQKNFGHGDQLLEANYLDQNQKKVKINRPWLPRKRFLPCEVHHGTIHS